MIREMKVALVKALADELCTIEMNPTIDGHVCKDYIALTEASHHAIDFLIANGFTISLQNGRLIVDKL